MKSCVLRCGMSLLFAAANLAGTAAAAPLTESEAREIAIDAYVYGYPLVTMEMTRRVMTNSTKPEGKLAPVGSFAHLRKYPTPTDKEVTAPNADTLYSLAWLDLSKEPMVFSIPDAGDRYFLMPMLSGWTDVFEVPGKRTTGDKAQTYVITGPSFAGKLPAGIKEYKAPTNMVWLLGRTYCSGTPEDYKKVHEFQDKLSLVPLSSYGKPYTPPLGKVDPKVDMKTPVREQVNSMTAAEYFTLLATLMKDNPASKADAPAIARFAKIGFVPGKPFDAGDADPAVAKVLADVPKAAFGKILGHFKSAGTEVNGWTLSTKTGLYGTEYLQRAFITAIGLGANRPQDAVYPTSEMDGAGKPYSGEKKYVLHFAKGKTPPVNGFWSITMYDANYFFVPNALEKYTVSQRDSLKHNADGSLDLYFQTESPGKDKEANWLPAPQGKFILMMRNYWPKETDPTIINGSWKPPAVKVVE